ncbi:bifunctional [glutamine synthetase] adenylyltransferase/[glutamine synthetase]-adenylyl-L-tyrosine phosphorylase [Rhabdaerophilum calidifontis]|uniref:bifunctional [glutamine synthetase] adenylyltransferase/[glutamine synthetase]-adenylyl-L-tyrosine phosphorylase n=1 Tax=Rhabdaerophilum calidifontis TaxID=2604328 RepID=UPI00140B30B1|nr:bifunctional [glutamine synthetase] adenylyltransferase/[glutamine synthetase]-adenylyl-L-tyrosine phosphorylase [Rhabdaerophilum calidifontis]
MPPPDPASPLLATLRPRAKSGREGIRRLDDWLADSEAATLRPLLDGRPEPRALLAAIAEGSPYLWRLVRRRPEVLAAMLAAPPAAQLAEILAETRAAGLLAVPADAMRALREAKARAALLIALADLGGVFDTVAVTEALSDFADASVAAALRFGLGEALRAGRFTPPDPSAPETELGLFVLALGKHGARELNYSSDIDLAIFYDPTRPGLTSATDPAGLAIGLVKGIVRLLNERNADGYVQRVDLRLRPDPGMTPIAMPVNAALGYYETVGQNWERAALIKARPVAGDLAAGARFIADLAPFIWRKYFDYAAIADIHAMKRQIYAVRGHEEIVVPGHDLKVGRGGIREIEFFVQTQQLVYGGRRPVLRGARTLDMLEELAREGWITPEAARELAGAYRFLRDLEHRVQMVNDEQTQKLPKSDEDLAALARLAGFTRAGLDKALTREMRIVERHYARLFEAVPGLASASGSLVFTGVEDDPETLRTLRRLGFQRPEAAAETVRGWHFGRRPAITTPRAREIVTDLVPGLLEAFSSASDPDGALNAFDNALVRMPAAVELLAILKNNGDLRRLFAEILGTAPRLSEIVAQNPHVLDVLVDPEFVRGLRPADARARIAPRLEREGLFEDFLDRARELARAERFLLGTRVLSRVLPVAEAGRAHTAIAEIFLDLVLARTRAEFARIYGEIPGAEMVLVGYGKAGSREMTANSDLDLVILYEAPPDSLSDGERALMPAEYFARLTQRLISALSAPMKTGTLYEIDLRLRPSGRKGTVATSLPGFRDYQTREAETWEHMALSRARVLAGDAGLAARVARTIAELLAAPREPSRLFADIAAMRALMAREKPGRDPFDVKDWPGGLVDCEFIAQGLVLAHAATHPDLVGLGTAETIIAASGKGLIDAGDAETLVAGWRLQSAVTQVNRLCISGPFDAETASPVYKRRLASLLDLPDFAFLRNELREAQKANRALFERIVGRLKA